MHFQMNKKSSTLDDLEGQYCNMNCIGCSASFLATAGFFVCCGPAMHFDMLWNVDLLYVMF